MCPAVSQKEDVVKKAPILGVLVAALIASLCCLGPALLVALGIGSVGISVWLAKSDWLFYVLGLAALGVMIVLLLKKQAGKACCPAAPTSTKSLLKIFFFIFFLGVIFFALRYGLTHHVSSWLYQRITTAPPGSSSSESHTALVSVSGMTCIICAKSIESHLRQTPGVHDVQVSFDQKKALVCYNPHQLSKSDIEKYIGETGYSGTIISEITCAKQGLSGNNL